MKVAVVSLKNDLESLVGFCVGSSRYLIVADVKNGKIESWKSIEIEVPIGMFLRRVVPEEGIEVFICGRYGGGVYGILKSLNVKTLVASGIKVRDALIKAESGELQEV